MVTRFLVDLVHLSLGPTALGLKCTKSTRNLEPMLYLLLSIISQADLLIIPITISVISSCWLEACQPSAWHSQLVSLLLSLLTSLRTYRQSLKFVTLDSTSSSCTAVMEALHVELCSKPCGNFLNVRYKVLSLSLTSSLPPTTLKNCLLVARMCFHRFQWPGITRTPLAGFQQGGGTSCCPHVPL